MSGAALRLPYRSNPIVMGFAGLFFVGCGVVLFNVARGNDRGLILNGVVHFDTAGATTFYWVLTALSAGLVLLAVIGLVRAFGSSHEVILDDRTLSAPRNGFSGTIVTVPLATITGLQIRTINRQRFLDIRHHGGKLTIVGSMLPSSDDLDSLADEIDRRWSVAAAGGSPPPSPNPMAPPAGFGRRGL